MTIFLGIFAVLVVTLLALLHVKRTRDRREIDAYSITPEELHQLMDLKQEFRLYDVRQPLDLLAHSMVIPGSQRIAPFDLKRSPSLIPKDEDVIVYCTCPSDNTAHLVIRRALSLQYTRARLLRGGLDAWRAKGYTTEPFTTPFRLETARAIV